jgi:hypothetical protein
MLPQMKNLNYEERLKLLKMPTLKFRRMSYWDDWSV